MIRVDLNTLLIVVLVLPGILAQSCRDTHELCRFWSTRGECDNNPQWMRPNCAISCGLCTTVQPTVIPRPGSAFDRPMSKFPSLELSQ